MMVASDSKGRIKDTDKEFLIDNRTLCTALAPGQWICPDLSTAT
jgi:hypothetical protein